MPPLYITIWNLQKFNSPPVSPFFSSHQIPSQLCPEPPWPSCENPAFLVPEIWDPRSTVLLKSTLEVWWLRSGGRSKRLGFPWWNCWMKQSPKWWMNQSQTAWWLTYPSKKWWSSSVGMMTFPTEWQKMFQTTKQQIVHKLWTKKIRLTPVAQAQFCEYSNTMKNFQEFEECPTRKCMETSDVNVGLVSHH